MANNNAPSLLKTSYYKKLCYHQHHLHCVSTNNLDIVENWINFMNWFHHDQDQQQQHTLIVGLGVQWPPEATCAATMQLCVGEDCLIIKLKQMDEIPSDSVLRKFLGDIKHIFIGVNPKRLRKMLSRTNHKLHIPRLVDIVDLAARRSGCERYDNKWKLAKTHLGVKGLRLGLWISRSNWESEILSHEQKAYACIDAFVSCSLGNLFI